ncbi:hypothetical protein [Cytobacillus sp. AMY 15.2]|uniref:hypothetical protein n=1 Tax=Cytobacillus sp. AMY 15.2 TaxID=2939563 RepID=UPI0020413C52|nr:hypothetical protein [Cytobacillus sp. AMY 15.2]
MYAISLRLINTNAFSIEVTLDALLMTVIEDGSSRGCHGRSRLVNKEFKLLLKK